MDFEEGGVFFLGSEDCEFKDDGKEASVTGFISTTDKDLVNDIVTDNCIKSMLNQISTGNIKFDIEHESFKGNTNLERELNKTKIPIAKAVEPIIDSQGRLKVKAILNRDHLRFNEVKGSLQNKFLDAFSIAFIPSKISREEIKGEQIRKLDDVKLLNVAFTGNPVNRKASISDVIFKSLDFLESKDLQSTEEINMKKSEKTEKKTEAENEIEVKDNTEVLKQLKGITERLNVLEQKANKADADKEDEEEESSQKPKENKPKTEKKSIDALYNEVKALNEKVEKYLSEPSYKSFVENMKEVLNKPGVEQKANATMGPLDYVG